MPEKDCRLTILMIGPRHVGKTVYLSALANSPAVGVADPPSVRAVKLHWEALARGENPPATAATLTNYLFSYSGSAGGDFCNVDLRLPDYDGYFAETLSEYEGGAQELAGLRALVREADGFIVFMPADAGDAATMEGLRVEIGGFMELARAEYGAKIEKPLVIAVNKWDLSPHFGSAGEDDAARAHVESVGIYRDIYHKLRSCFADIVILPLSAYGKSAQNGKPSPNGLSPWRVEEPVALIVEKCFASLARKAANLERNADWPALARLLLRTRPLWRRCPAFDWEPLLQTALRNCHARLARALAGAQNAAEYEKLWQGAPERDFLANFSPAQRASLEDIKNRALAASMEDLGKKLAAAKNGADFEAILQNAAESKYLADLDPEARAKVLALKERHLAGERRKKGIRRVWIALLLLLCALLGWGAYMYTDFRNAYARADNPALGAAGRWRNLAEFVTVWQANPLAARFFAPTLREAAEKRASLVDAAVADIEGRLPQTEALADVCARSAAAALLLDEARATGLNPPPGLVHRLEMLEKTSAALCAAKSGILNAKTGKELEDARARLAALPESAEVAALRASALARAGEVAALEAASPEAARLAAIRERHKNLAAAPNLNEAEDFVRAYQDDPDEEARALAEKVRAGMGERFYRALLQLARKMETFGAAELGPLRETARLGAKYGLSAAQRENIAEELQRRAEARDRQMLAGVSGRVAGPGDLAALEGQLREIRNFPEALSLGGNIFEYRRPGDLRDALAAHEQNAALYRGIGRSGLLIGNFEVAAQAENALDLHGRRLGSAFTRNRELVVRFPGDMGEISYKTSPLADHEEEGGKIYSLNFGPLTLRPVEGEAILKEENFGGADMGCSTPLAIRPADLFAILNTGVWRLPLGGTCHGLSFIFHK